MLNVGVYAKRIINPSAFFSLLPPSLKLVSAQAVYCDTRGEMTHARYVKNITQYELDEG